MMGQQKSEPQLFNYAVNLEKRVRANDPLHREIGVRHQILTELAGVKSLRGQ